jgi:hypothetical protein
MTSMENYSLKIFNIGYYEKYYAKARSHMRAGE